MDEDEGHGVRYKALEDMSDSDETEMDLSDNEDQHTANDAEQPRKRQARMENKPSDGDSAPRWSNPDPYTALPPPDESQRKKKDVVKLIRKARVTANSDDSTKAEAVADDFISFNFGDDAIEVGDGHVNISDDESGKGVPGAPTGPRYSHRQIIQKQMPTSSNVELPRQPTFSAISIPNKPPSKSSKPLVLDHTSDSALGSRKRNINDEIKAPPPAPKKSFSLKPSNGNILKEWEIRGNSTGTPWLDIDHSDTANMGVWLHKEIVDFYHHVKPRVFEQAIRTKLVDSLRTAIKERYNDCDIHCFGSFVAGLYLPTADMDIVFVSDRFMRDSRGVYNDKRFLFQFRSFLEKRCIPVPGSIEVIHKARVPLVKYVDKLTGLKIDISFENDTGLIANKTFKEWMAQFPAMPILVTLIKHFLAMRGLNEPANGGIGGLSVTCLVVSLLQNMPQVRSGNMIPEHHLGEILMEFLDLYGNEFNYTTTAIQLDPPGYVSKSRNKEVVYKNLNRLSIIDPNNPSNDIAGGSSNTPAVLLSLSQAYKDLQSRMGGLQYATNRRNQSILGCILAGNYSSFDLQREHLAHVHEKIYGPITGT
jgi:non-canonical poly(A) RNA polymerase PAPD5/7